MILYCHIILSPSCPSFSPSLSLSPSLPPSFSLPLFPLSLSPTLPPSSPSRSPSLSLSPSLPLSLSPSLPLSLSSSRSLWLKACSCMLQQSQTELKFELPLPIVARNIILEFADFYENTQV